MANELVRFQVEVSKVEMEDLEHLVGLGGVRTKKDLFNTALSLLRWAAKQSELGRKIGSLDESANTFRELNLPVLDVLEAHAARGSLKVARVEHQKRSTRHTNGATAPGSLPPR